MRGNLVDNEVEDGTAYIRGQLDLHMVTGRYSSLLVKMLARCVEDRRANIFTIFHEIGFLEGATHAPVTRTKPANRLKGSLLAAAAFGTSIIFRPRLSRKTF
jgi:hypothetical protein